MIVATPKALAGWYKSVGLTHMEVAKRYFNDTKTNF